MCCFVLLFLTSACAAAEGVPPVYLGCDLGETRTVDRVSLTPRPLAHGYCAEKFAVEVSTDGQHYTEVRRAYKPSGPQTDTFAFAPTLARFVRLKVWTSWERAPNGNNVQVAEVGIYGPDGDLNLARTGRMWATSTAADEPGGRCFQPAMANDGDPRTFWCSADQSVNQPDQRRAAADIGGEMKPPYFTPEEREAWTARVRAVLDPGRRRVGRTRAACPSPALADLRDRFRDPPAEDRPTCLWLWNDDLDEAQLRAQVREMKAHGVGGVHLFPVPEGFRGYEGMRPEYLSAGFFRAVEAAVEEARRQGVVVDLYDEGAWPSGEAFGQVVADHPELRGRILRRAVEEVLGPTEVALGVPEGTVAVVGMEKAKAQVEDLTAYVRSGTLSWSAPAGTWAIWFFVDEPQGGSDLLNPRVGQRFLQLTHERYAERVGREFGRTIRGIFTDEPAVRGAALGGEGIKWTHDFLPVFRDRKGYSLGRYLPILFAENDAEIAPFYTPNEIAAVRYDYFDVWTAMMAAAYFRPIQEWCHAHGIEALGHLGGEDSLWEHARHGFGHYFRPMRYFDVPGIDLIWRQLFPGQRNGNFPKFAGSAAHHAGQSRTLSESFAVSGYGLSYAQMKWLTDYQYVRGINRLCLACFYYSTRGSRVFFTHSNFFVGNPLWPYFDRYADYVGRLGTLLREGEPVVHVAVYYPVTSLWITRDPAISEVLEEVGQTLLAAQVDYEYLDDAALLEHLDRYRVLILPRTVTLPLRVVRRIARFRRRGGVVIAVDGRPTRSCERGRQTAFEAEVESLFGAGERVYELPREAFASQLNLVTNVPGVVDFRLAEPHPHLRYCHRQAGEIHLYFLTNEADTPQSFRAWFAAPGEPEVWNPEDGSMTSVSRAADGSLSLSLPPWGSLFAVFADGERRGGKGTEGERRGGEGEMTWEPVLTLGGTWDLRVVRSFEFRDSQLRLDEPMEAPPRQAALGPWADLGLADFSGSIEYRQTFEWPGPAGESARFWLDLGTVRYVADVWLNGQHVGTRLWPPFRVEVTSHLRSGANELAILVTNTLANQILRPDVQAEADRRGWLTVYSRGTVPYEREALPSGLWGPVRLCRQESGGN